MTLKDIVDTRRAYRSLGPVRITEDMIRDLADHAGLAPSCFNNQPWRYVFVTDEAVLKELQGAMSRGNEWTGLGSMVVAVFSKDKLDCVVKDRTYHLFDTGMATAFMILRATEMGLVAHPIAGFNPREVKRILCIPEDMDLITLLIVGKKKEEMDPVLSLKQAEMEETRTERLDFGAIGFLNKYTGETSDIEK
jgi:nitroreductase